MADLTELTRTTKKLIVRRKSLSNSLTPDLLGRTSPAGVEFSSFIGSVIVDMIEGEGAQV